VLDVALSVCGVNVEAAVAIAISEILWADEVTLCTKAPVFCRAQLLEQGRAKRQGKKAREKARQVKEKLRW
jgi:hypothetical protein